MISLALLLALTPASPAHAVSAAEERTAQLEADVIAGSADDVRGLLDQGFDPNGRDKDGNTALMFAGSAEITKLLLSRGAKADLKNKRGETALLKANDPERIAALLEAGADPNVKDKKGNTALLNCAAAGRRDGVLALLKKGADAKAADDDGRTPLMAAAGGDNAMLLADLLAAGADPNAKQKKNGSTALMIAAYGGRVENVKVLLAGAADPNVRNKAGQTAFMVAQVFNQADVVDFLRGYGSEPPNAGLAAKNAAPAAVSSDVDAPNFSRPENPADYALVVGVETYGNPDLPPARFARRDAEAVRRHLVALGYPPDNIALLTDGQATKTALVKYLQNWLPRRASAKSTVFVYFSGHGAPDPASGQAYLVPSDGDPQYLKETAYPVKSLYDDLGALKAGRVLLVLDSCFSGAGGRSVLAKGVRPLVNKVDLGGAGASDAVASLTASDAAEISGTLESQGHGLFTYYLLKGLDGAAAGKDGAVTLQGLYDYLAPKVHDEAWRQNRDQTPRLSASPASAAARLR
jgi:ankyrin repeat protein